MPPTEISGWQQFSKNFYDLLLLDVNDAVERWIYISTQIRRKNTHIPILFITAKNMQEDKIAGFQSGRR
jgi:two-component system OmpR family response regulator